MATVISLPDAFLGMAVAPPLWTIAPFVLLLLGIAIGPLLAPHFWGRHHAKVAVGLGALVVAYYLFVWQDGARVWHAAEEYLGFIFLIGSLFVIAGGIDLQVPEGPPTPAGNVVFLIVGALLSNVIGTTGASMVLIRPWLRRNRERLAAYQVIFFIFIVSNVGGCLTPVGDPPLFLGYLNHIPFFWPLRHLALYWAIALAGLLVIFYSWDRRSWRAAGSPVKTRPGKWTLHGGLNVALLGGVLGALFMPALWRDGTLAAATLLSLWRTPRTVRQANDFTFAPMAEIVWLFVGIFATMMPALDYLEQHAGALGIDTPGKFYWITGGLSAVLDNAPTYLATLGISLAQNGHRLGNTSGMAAHLASHGLDVAGISVGAVFFGAMTYLGNGPNFMVRAIAQHAGVRMPGFFGYILYYALPCLLPVLFLIYTVFFR